MEAMIGKLKAQLDEDLSKITGAADVEKINIAYL